MIEAVSESLLALYTTQVSNNFIVHAFAMELKLQSNPTAVRIKVPGVRYRAYQTRGYQFKLKDMTGKSHVFDAIGMDITRPYGTLEVLLGMSSRSVHCKDGREVGELRLNKSIFYPGCVLTGCAPAVQDGKEEINKKAATTKPRGSSSRTSDDKGSSSSESCRCQKQHGPQILGKETAHSHSSTTLVNMKSSPWVK